MIQGMHNKATLIKKKLKKKHVCLVCSLREKRHSKSCIFPLRILEAQCRISVQIEDFTKSSINFTSVDFWLNQYGLAYHWSSLFKKKKKNCFFFLFTCFLCLLSLPPVHCLLQSDNINVHLSFTELDFGSINLAREMVVKSWMLEMFLVITLEVQKLGVVQLAFTL